MPMAKYAGIAAIKSQKRKEFVEGIVSALLSPSIYRGLSKKISEETFVYKVIPVLEGKLAKLFLKENPDRDFDWAEKKAENALFWEHNTNTVVNHTQFFGTQHRPDMFIRHGEDYRVAIEYKLVSSGNDIRAALGQCLVYASDYEFTIALLYDVTADSKIKRAYDNGMLENQLIDKLWSDYGAKLIVVSPK